MQTITVTIGRNVGVMPMDSEVWAEFQREARHLVASMTETIVYEGNSESVWSGYREESTIYHAEGFTGDEVNLVAGLMYLASKYRQEAIGLAIGDGQLVWAPRQDRAYA